ncbi:cytidylate kinase-like family protein [uncultured Sphaerochaeta sp.]|uniref:cytidylate kinase-like family protein n=1 Tax=uncultured Sphaerochaeta sp. TaxID=886478 RepID=UPI002A0A1680|nr:cytidylate kinase-like family protein [uncultured Sphaerochaeta sp.]
MENYVVTLNRQFGSLGRTIAEQMAVNLGVEYYDRDIIDTVSHRLSLPVSVISDREEAAGGTYFSRRFPLGNVTNQEQDEIFEVQKNLILDLAERESCIIVGRCSEFVLKDKKNVFSIYIYAPYEERLKNCVDYLYMDPKEAKKEIVAVDKARDAYHMHYAGYLPSDLRHNHILVDSSVLGVTQTAMRLADIIRDKFEDVNHGELNSL